MDTEPNSSNIHEITPKIEDLVPYKQLSCTECDQTFINIGNLQMHLSKHHKKSHDDIKLIICGLKSTNEIDKNCTNIFYCPIESCIYNQRFKRGGRFFSNFKYIRQHFQKVHIEKTFQCKKCLKMFSTTGLCATHELTCGEIFPCGSCERSYLTREALWTHAKRKDHLINYNTLPGVVSMPNPRIKRKIQKEISELSQDEDLNKLNKIIKIEKTSSPEEIIEMHKLAKKDDALIEIDNEKKNLILQNTIIIQSNTPIFGSEGNNQSPDVNNIKHIKILPVDLNQLIKLQQSSRKICNYISVTPVTINTSPPFSSKSVFNTSFSPIFQDDLVYNKSSNSFENEELLENNRNTVCYQSPNLNETRIKTGLINESPTRLIFDDDNQISPNYKMSQTSNFYEDSCFEQLANYNHMETQTEFASLEYYSHNETQTYDDFFNELGLADIQTQTNWSDYDQCNSCGNLMNNGNEKKQAGVQCTGSHDDFLVSTETQTSFTQCLLNYDNGGSADPSQIISNELDELLNDTTNFNFESTCTQT